MGSPAARRVPLRGAGDGVSAAEAFREHTVQECRQLSLGATIKFGVWSLGM